MKGTISVNHKSGMKVSLPSAMSVLAVVLSFGILILSHPLMGWSQVAGTAEQQSLTTLADCYLNNDARPSGGSSVDTTMANLIVKTTVLEKLTFVCKSLISQEHRIVDVNLHAKMIDNIETLVPLNRSVEITTCTRDINGSILECVSETPTKDLPPVACSLKKPYQRSPIIMKSIASTNESMPSNRMEVDSDVFSCRDAKGNPALKNVVMFSNMFEYIEATKPAKKSIESVSCVTDIVSASVLGCRFNSVS